MSTCSCDTNHSKGESFWQKLATEYQNRIQYLKQKTVEVRDRLETMQLQMPAYFCYQVLQYPDNIKENTEKFMRELQEKQTETSAATKNCFCNPCPVKIPANFPENLYNYEYPTKIGMYVQSYLKPKKIIKPLSKDCSCQHCAEKVIKKLLAERDVEKEPTTKPSIKRICECDICKSMVPERDCNNAKIRGDKKEFRLNEVVECTCAGNKELILSDKTVCDCSVCAQEVLNRIQSLAIEFEPFSCGCDGRVEPNPLVLTGSDIPICQCESCKIELNKRMGITQETQAIAKPQDAICTCKTHPFSDQICDCSICAESLIPLETCDCKTGDIEVPICTCSTCSKKLKKVVDITDEDRCICHCDYCDEEIQNQKAQRIEAQKIEEEKNKCKEIIRCICNCEICNIPKGSDNPICLCSSYKETANASRDTSESKCTGSDTTSTSNSSESKDSSVCSCSTPPIVKEYHSSPCANVTTIKPASSSFVCYCSPEMTPPNGSPCSPSIATKPNTLESNQTSSSNTESVSLGTCSCSLCNSRRSTSSRCESSPSDFRPQVDSIKVSSTSCPCSPNTPETNESCSTNSNTSSSSNSTVSKETSSEYSSEYCNTNKDCDCPSKSEN